MSTANAMQLIDEHVGFLHNLEVRDVLRFWQTEQEALLSDYRARDATSETLSRSKQRPDDHSDHEWPRFDEETERNRILSRSQRVALARALVYLEDPALRRGTTASLDEVRAYLSDIDSLIGRQTLTKAEKLQLANTPPTEVVEVFALIDKATERLCAAMGVEINEDDAMACAQKIVDIADRHFAPLANADANGGAEPATVDGATSSATTAQRTTIGLSAAEQVEIDDAMAQEHEETDLVDEGREAPAHDATLDIDEEMT